MTITPCQASQSVMWGYSSSSRALAKPTFMAAQPWRSLGHFSAPTGTQPSSTASQLAERKYFCKDGHDILFADVPGMKSVSHQWKPGGARDERGPNPGPGAVTAMHRPLTG